MGEKTYEESSTIIKAKAIRKTDILRVRLLISGALVLMGIFVYWFADPSHIGYPLLFWLLTIALFFKLLKMLHEWYHYWHVSIPKPPELKRQYTVDIFTTFCPGEPKDMIVNTLRAMQAIRYPHTSYLCDEGDDPELREICQGMGVVHVTRKEKINAKAGNINNALRRAKGEIAIILDPDHVPHPDFIDRVLPYFEDPKVGYVQIVQAYGNQGESFVAKGAAEQTYHFYGPMMMTMNTYGTVQALGANCTFRRAALDEIGGHAAGLSEDMHTAMQLHAKGWKSVYVPEVLSRGLVPATIPAYYKQQLKWSRGTFDLLFKVYPKLFRNFTWRQKLHYFTLPMYFLFGLVNFIDIIVPILALVLAETPWAVNIKNFAVIFVPLCIMSLIIRLFAQRWLMEPHERGFHFTGGLLRTGTWWIFLLGFIYTLLDIKVPYIPTPKGDELQNNWKLGMPNFIASIICITAAAYGLSIDWNPYSFAMATYAVINGCILGYAALIAQEKFMKQLRDWLSLSRLWSMVTYPVDFAVQRFRFAMYSMFSNGTIAIACVAALLFLGYTRGDQSQLEPFSVRKKELGGFYKGIHLEGSLSASSIMPVKKMEALLDLSFDVVVIDQVWKESDIQQFPSALLSDISRKGAVPMINWMPSAVGFPGMPSGSSPCKLIAAGCFDDYISSYALRLRSFSEPVFINFAPEPDDTSEAWVNDQAVDPEEYRKAWDHIHRLFTAEGVYNVTWVWSIRYPASAEAYYPGEKQVDWIGVNCANYKHSDEYPEGFTFEQIYKSFRDRIGKHQKPVMVTGFGTSGSDEGRAKWIKDAFASIDKYFPEIRSVIASGTSVPAIGSVNSCMALTEALSHKDFGKRPFEYGMSTGVKPARVDYTSPFIRGSAGSWELLVKNEPFYIRGVAYNTGHDWRDGNIPLTRKQLEYDFRMVREMGANSIRRYDAGLYDRNILDVAEQEGLKVQFGFWFDPKIDYYRDTIKVREYIERVEATVKKYKDHPSIFAWSVGNETWGLLKHNYGKPYLTRVRGHYLKMIEHLAQRIHVIDPTRPVFSSMEHEEFQLGGEIAAFREGAPSLDAIGVNSYYEEQICHLNYLARKFDSLRPYIVSEFGPRGYWNSDYTRLTKDSLVIEDDDSEKARYFVNEWNKYVKNYNGYNLGGFAYCWRDRMEGSNTWFGLVDQLGRPKISYHALRHQWTGHPFPAGGLPRVQIAAPGITLKPGKEYVFDAVISGRAGESYNYEWQLRKKDYMEEVNKIKVSDGGKKVVVNIPKESSNYRLYLYVSDDEGNVITASHPLSVDWK
jgi:cellulose synthase (UDP-forming)